MKRYGWLFLALLLVAAFPAAAQDEKIVYATAQRYENGLMIWRSDTGHIWALVNNGQAFNFPATTYASLPDNPIFGDPPSRLRPIFGMGKVWGHYQNVRAALGWPTLNELGFEMPIRTTRSAVYLTQLDGSVIQIRANGTWQRSYGSLPAPSILAFSATPDPVTAGGTVTLNWQAQGTDSVLIELYPAGSHIPTQIIANLPLVGSTTVTVPTGFTSGARFVLWGVNRSQHPVPVTLWARIVSQERVIGTRLNPGPFTTQAAFQQYENGFMLWRADTGDVMAFGGSSGGQILTFSQGGYAGWPDPLDVAIPANRVRVVNAFGKVWGNIQQVRDMLGYATGQEQGYTMTVRHFESGASAFSLPDSRTAYTHWGFWNF
jgi:hypothetical protein